MMDSPTRVRLIVLPFHLDFIALSLSCIHHNGCTLWPLLWCTSGMGLDLPGFMLHMFCYVDLFDIVLMALELVVPSYEILAKRRVSCGQNHP